MLGKIFQITAFLFLYAGTALAQDNSMGKSHIKGHWAVPCSSVPGELIDGLGKLFFSAQVRVENNMFMMDRTVYTDPSCQNSHPMFPDMPIAGKYRAMSDGKHILGGKERPVKRFEVTVTSAQNALSIYDDVNPGTAKQSFMAYLDNENSGRLFVPLDGDMGEIMMGVSLPGEYLQYSRVHRSPPRSLDEIYPKPAQNVEDGHASILPNAQNAVTPTSCEVFSKDRQSNETTYLGCQENINFPQKQFKMLCDVFTHTVDHQASGEMFGQLKNRQCTEKDKQPFCIFGHKIYGSDIKAYSPLFTEESCESVYGQWAVSE